ncbi:hypothetical protein BC830DRAFT_1122393 [Chytriomyces sp. MP71]|nr:hypothetical protein BC830DRAFT_1122393 [Chytriomyces sp. MP71]
MSASNSMTRILLLSLLVSTAMTEVALNEQKDASAVDMTSFNMVTSNLRGSPAMPHHEAYSASESRISRLVAKQDKAREREARNYGMNDIPKPVTLKDSPSEVSPKLFSPQYSAPRGGRFRSRNPINHNVMQSESGQWNLPNLTRPDLRMRHVRHLRGISALRQYEKGEVHEWFYWVFTGMWLMLGFAFVYAISLI